MPFARPGARRAASALVAALLTAALLAGCGSGTGNVGTSGSSSLELQGELNPPKPAPEISLRNWDGRPVRLSEFRGKAVFLTFIYDHCPDTCPLIVSKLHAALAELGSRAADAQIIAVSVDPRGDTPKTVRDFLRRRLMLGRMDYLIGSRRELEPVWKAFGVSSEASPEKRENPVGGQVGHTAVVYGLTGKGKILALWDPFFKPSEISHDAPLLAGM